MNCGEVTHISISHSSIRRREKIFREAYTRISVKLEKARQLNYFGQIAKAIPNVLIEVVNQIARIVHSENNVVGKLQNLTGLANQKVDNSIHKEHYDRMHEKLTQNKSYTKRMVRIRSKTVEPVIGTLVNFMNMKRVNTRGIKSSNKHVLMASLVYKLQKYLRFIVKKTDISAQAISLPEGKNLCLSQKPTNIH